MSDYQEMVEFRCRSHNYNKLLLNYYITGVSSNIHLEGVELKCNRCKTCNSIQKLYGVDVN